MSFISKLFGPEPVAVPPPTPRVPKVQFIEKDMEISSEQITLIYTNAFGQTFQESVGDKVDAFSGYHTLDQSISGTEILHLFKVAGDLQFLPLEGEPCVIVPQVIPAQTVVDRIIRNFNEQSIITIHRSAEDVEIFRPVRVTVFRPKKSKGNSKKQLELPVTKTVKVLAAMVTYE